ncbi:MAG: hypothetical protein IJH78_00195 [Clostridia bacterium]|nr:hypothetical protein [Clostridia bacterium]
MNTTSVLLLQILVIVFVGTAALLYAVLHIYATVCSVTLEQQCRKNSLSEEDARALFERYFYADMQAEIAKTGRQVNIALLIAPVLLTVLWLFGSGADQYASLRLLLVVFLIACGVFLLGRITTGITMVALPSGGPDMNRAKAGLRASLKKHSRPMLLILLLYALLYWLLSV